MCLVEIIAQLNALYTATTKAMPRTHAAEEALQDAGVHIVNAMDAVKSAISAEVEYEREDA